MLCTCSCPAASAHKATAPPYCPRRAPLLPADNEALKLKMAQAAETHRKIHEQYNLPYEVEPGSVMDRAQKFWKKKQARK